MPAFVGWIARSQISKKLTRRSSRIVNEGHRAAQIIAGIRAMFRKAAGERWPVAVNELICDVVSTSLGELKSSRVSLTLELLDDLSPVQADRVQLQQVLLNLFTNAVELHGLGHRSSSRAPRPFRASGGLGDYRVSKIPAPGINHEQAERMFEEFFTTKPNGIGLGLSICRSIVEAHGGRLSASPVRPYGSVFQVMLPAAN